MEKAVQPQLSDVDIPFEIKKELLEAKPYRKGRPL